MMSAANGQTRPTPFILEARAKGINPFAVVRDEAPPPPVTFPRAPGVAETLTRGERAVYLKGREQVLTLGLQAVKGAFANQEIAKLENHLSLTYEQTATRITARTKRPHDPDLQPYLDALHEAQLLRMGQTMSQVADSTERQVHAIVDQPIEPDEERPGFFQKVLRGQPRS